MGRLVQIAAGQHEVLLPDGGAYDEGEQVTLTDAQWDQVDTDLIGPVITDLGATGGTGGIVKARYVAHWFSLTPDPIASGVPYTLFVNTLDDDTGNIVVPKKANQVDEGFPAPYLEVVDPGLYSMRVHGQFNSIGGTHHTGVADIAAAVPVDYPAGEILVERTIPYVLNDPVTPLSPVNFTVEVPGMWLAPGLIVIGTLTIANSLSGADDDLALYELEVELTKFA
jgi:hypothetical protein